MSLVSAALAATADAPVASNWWDNVSPMISSGLAVVVTGMIGWVANLFRQKLNIDIEAVHRDALHSAIMSGVNAALAKLGKYIAPLPPAVKADVVTEAVAYATKSVPDAITALDAKPEVLAKMALAKLNIIEEAAAPVAVTPVAKSPSKS